ncbi:MAG: alpha-hydroxy-acid oxidizing protein [bacterium]
MDRTIMIIGAGEMQVPAIRVAQKMGLTTVVLDYNPNAPGMGLADYPVEMSTRDFEGCVRVARDFEEGEIDGVITVGTDASLSQAAVSEALDLPGIKFDTAERATNKVKMRRAWARAKIPQPEFRGIWELDEAQGAARDLGFPLVIKPADNMGGRGVKKLADKDDLVEGFRAAKQASPRGELIIEEYLEGEEFSTDTLFREGELIHQVIADRIIEREPYFIETGHVLPSNQPEKVQEKILKTAEEAAEALGIDVGAAKGDIKMTPEGPKMVEMAARLSGGYMSGYTYPLATGRSIIRDALKIAIGQKPDCPLDPPIRQVAVEKAVIPPPGEIRKITGHEKIMEMDGVEEIFIKSDIGDKISKPKSNLDKPANVIVSGSNHQTALQRAEKAVETIKFEVGPPPELSWEGIKNRARTRFQGSCSVCSTCDGVACAGEVPGVGGVGTGETFQENLRALKKYKINTRYIQKNSRPELKTKLLDFTLDFPVLAAPITGTGTNMNGALSEEEYTEAVVKGCVEAGTVAMVGDGASIHKYKIGIGALEAKDGRGIPIFKPRLETQEVEKRLKWAEDAGARAAGVDIDAINHRAMKRRGKQTRAYDLKTIKELIDSTSLKFILKGIMTPADARRAVQAGADAIVISNHGGRILDEQPGTARVLPEIIKEIQGEITVLIDGGIRSGVDVFKCLALGADAVLIGRPIMIGAVGAGSRGVNHYLNKIKTELRKVFLLTDQSNPAEIEEESIRKIN